MPDQKLVIGVDIGGTNTRAGVVDSEGNVLAVGKRLTQAEVGPEAVANQINEAIAEARELSGLAEDRFAAVGCGMPGRTTAQGEVLWSPNFKDIEGFFLGPAISEPTGLPVYIANDVNVAVMGEFKYGAGKGYNDIVMLTLGTGIGGGIIIGGKLLGGSNGGGGEIGHQVINPGGRVCGCGNHGCFEAMAGRDAIIERATLKLQQGCPSVLQQRFGSQADKITPEEIAIGAGEGDRVCIETLNETGYWVGVGIANAVNLLNPQIVLVGGGIANGGEPLWGPLLSTVQAIAIEESYTACRIVKVGDNDDSGILGAASLAFDSVQ